MLLILCPLSFELQNVLTAIQEDGLTVREELTSTGLKTYVCDELRWILSLGGHGKTQFALQTQALWHHYPKSLGVVCLGACGSLDRNVKALDIVIATKTIEHDYKLRFMPRPPPEYSASEQLLSRIRKAKLDVHFGVVASGDEDIVESARAQELALATGAIAVAWEGAGGARACQFLKIPYIEIRGVTDDADSDAVSHFKTNVPLVMKKAYSFLKQAFRPPHT